MGLLSQLPDITPETRDLAARALSRRTGVMGDLTNLRLRYEEIMRWVNPPWDPTALRVDPRPEQATMMRQGRNKIHVDLVSQVVDRWAALQAGIPFIFRNRPRFISAPVETKDPNETELNRRTYEIDRQMAQAHTEEVEATTAEWIEAADFNRTWLWANWCKEAFGKAIVKSGWDPDEDRPTAELYENPATVAYGWSKRYGTRKLAWVSVFDQLDVTQIKAQFGIDLPINDNTGTVDISAWAYNGDLTTDMDMRVEQQNSLQHMVTIEEYWEWVPGTPKTDDMPRVPGFVRFAFIIAGRVVEMKEYKFLKRLPFHVLENVHLPTYMHGKSTAEQAISINEAYDDLLTRQHEVIEFESGPRYVGMGMKNSGDDIDVPAPFEMAMLDLDQDIHQLDTRVDFFPSELHGKQLIEEALTRETGLTAIAWGMSPNAQTSGRAMSAEWRAVELPLTNRLMNQGPVAKELLQCWWDYAEAYSPSAKTIGKGDRNFEILWVPFDIRDKTEKTLDIVQRLQAHVLDPETAIEELGYENGSEIMAKIRRYLLDPVYNPLNVQQYLTLQQLALSIRQQSMEVAAQEQQMGAQQQGVQPGGPQVNGQSPIDLMAQGTNAAGQQAQGPGGPVTTADNQPGMSPGGGGLDMKNGILMRTPLGQGGVGNQVQVQLGGGGPAPAAGQQPA